MVSQSYFILDCCDAIAANDSCDCHCDELVDVDVDSKYSDKNHYCVQMNVSVMVNNHKYHWHMSANVDDDCEYVGDSQKVYFHNLTGVCHREKGFEVV